MQDTVEIDINADFQLEEFEGEFLLYSVSAGTAVYLNETAHLVWLLCHEEMNLGEVVQFLIDKYPEQRDQVREDVTAALATLVEQGVAALRHG